MSPMANQGKTESDGGKDGVCMSISEQKPHHGQAPGCIQVQGSSERPQLWGRLPGLHSPGGLRCLLSHCIPHGFLLLLLQVIETQRKPVKAKEECPWNTGHCEGPLSLRPESRQTASLPLHAPPFFRPAAGHMAGASASTSL